MRLWLRIAAFACVFAAAPARADTHLDTTTDVGLFTAVITGSHIGFGNPTPDTGVVPGAALEVTQHVDRFRLHLEGIPTVGAAGSQVGPYGRSSASLSLLNTTAMVDVDAHHFFRVGAGYQFVDLTNIDGDDGVRNAVRIASPIYVVGATLPLSAGHFVEINVMDDPNLRGDLLAYDTMGVAGINQQEIGAEVDYSAAYGWRRGNVEYLVGGRGLSYHTRNASTGALVDRNVGGGATFEVRFLLGKK